jgi:hypothetical protein
MLVLALLHPLGPLLPFYLSGSFALIWRRSLVRPWRFFALGGLALLALYMSLGVYFAPVIKVPATVKQLNMSESVAPDALAPAYAGLPSSWFEYRAPIIVILASIPLLLLIRRLARRGRAFWQREPGADDE